MILLKITTRIPERVLVSNFGNPVAKPFIIRFTGLWKHTITENLIYKNLSAKPWNKIFHGRRVPWNILNFIKRL